MSALVVLGMLWAAVLVPPVVRARANRRREFIDSFRHQMGTLGTKARHSAVLSAGPGQRPRPRARPPANAARRRRAILRSLLIGIAVASAVGAVPSLRMAWAAGLFLVNAFLLYLCLLVHQRRPTRTRTRARARRPAGANWADVNVQFAPAH
jgi:hypothetical protein